MSGRMKAMVAELTADKKRLSILLGLVAVGLLLWGRLLLQREVPRTAIATPTAAKVASTGKGRSATPDSAAQEHVASLPVVYADLASRPDRDLFAWDTSRYERDPASVRKTSEKSDPIPADVTTVADLVARAKARLTLQTTVLGDQPKAMINGQLLKVGQVVEGFELKEVMPRGVRLGCTTERGETVTVELEL